MTRVLIADPDFRTRQAFELLLIRARSRQVIFDDRGCRRRPREQNGIQVRLRARRVM